MGKSSSIKSIITKFFLPVFLVSITAAYLINIRINQLTRADVFVSYITSSPEAPVYGAPFDCFIGVSYDEPDLACGLRRVGENDTVLPWDICPKRNGLGRQSTKNNTASYKCIADASTGVPGPGTYELIAWRFYSDGASGKSLATKTITIADHAPVPTATPTSIPSQIPILTNAPIPSNTPTNTPTDIPTNIPIPTQPIGGIIFPTVTLAPSPTVYFLGYNASPTLIIPSLHETPRSDVPYPTAGRYDGGVPHFSIDLKPAVGTAKKIETAVITSAKYGLSLSASFLRNVWKNFFDEASF